MAKKPRKHTGTTDKALVPVPALTPTLIPGTGIVPDAAYRNAHHPAQPGPWQDEPDKIAWTDRATGYPCIVLREAHGAYGSYVGLPPTHPLSGYAADALPPIMGRGLHRPVSYASPCERRLPEPLSICHVADERRAPPRAARRDPRSASTIDTPHDNAWWLGLVFDGPRDHVPARRGSRPLAAERGETYRDAAFAIGQAEALARQLYAWAQAHGTNELHPDADSAEAQRNEESAGTPRALPAPDRENGQ